MAILVAALAGPAVARSAALAPVPAASPGHAAASSAALTDRVVVSWRSARAGGAEGSRERLAVVEAATGRTARAVRDAANGSIVYDLGRPLGTDADRIVDALRRAPGIVAAEPDHWVTLDDWSPPNDPYAANLWGLVGPDAGSPYGADAQGAWGTTTGDGIVVAVIDTGLVAHPDLAGRAVAGYDFISSPSVANDGDGRDADPSDPGDWCPGPSRGSSWHGTHVAGTIGALAGNGIGVFGGAPGVRIQPVRVLGTCGGYLSDVSDAITWAAGGAVSGVPANATPARVLNLSLSAAVAPCPAGLASAIAGARALGSVVVVAAGNAGADASGYAPANCPGALTVAATDVSGLRASFSNHGSTVEIAGPGVAILSTIDTGTTVPEGPAYAYYSGTSMASPHVALSAALVASAHPGLSVDEIEIALLATATPFAADPSVDGCPVSGCGAGIVNAARAIASLASGWPGDAFSDATGITGPSGSLMGFNTVATAESGEPGTSTTDGADGPHRTVWYAWTAPASGSVTIDLCVDTVFDTMLAVYAGSSLETLTRIADDDDTVGCGSGTQSRVTFAATSGSEYQIQVDGHGGATGTYRLRWAIDTTPPAGTISIAGGAGYTASTTVSVAVPATDALSGVTHVRLSNVSTTSGGILAQGRTYAATSPIAWSLANATYGGSTTNGTRRVFAQWRDAAGNWSAVKSDAIVLDTVNPTATAPTHAMPRLSRIGTGTIPVFLTWSGSDATSGVARFELEVSTDSTAYAPVGLASPTTRQTTRQLAADHSYRFRVRAIDRAGRPSAWMYGPRFTVRVVQETAAKVSYAGAWTTASIPSASGGAVRYATTAGAEANLSFIGRSVAWVAVTGPTRGRANVYLDGAYVRTIDLYAATTTTRIITFSRNFSTSEAHTLTIRVLGTAGRPRVDLDAFVFLR